MRRGGGAYNAVRQRGRSRAVESKASGADIYMKCVGWKCRFKSVLVLGIVLLAVAPLSARQTPSPAATRTSTIPLTLAASLATPDPATSVNEKLAQLDQRVTEAKSSADNAWMLVSAALVLMVWGKGGFLNASLGGKFPTLDFAGGTVVHISSGVSALVCALYLGKRTGYPRQPMPPHSLVLSFIGACLLWVGWFGFNAGSALAS